MYGIVQCILLISSLYEFTVHILLCVVEMARFVRNSSSNWVHLQQKVLLGSLETTSP